MCMYDEAHDLLNKPRVSGSYGPLVSVPASMNLTCEHSQAVWRENYI